MSLSAPQLSRRLLRRVLLVTCGASLLLGLVFVLLYRAEREHDRRHTAMLLNATLQVAWENAMLTSDHSGLDTLLQGLGRLPGVEAVRVLAPDGEVRFADRAELRGTHLPALPLAAGSTRVEALDTADGPRLRALTPVPNRPGCAGCHGDPAAQPLNGVLVVDYDVAPVDAGTQRSAWLFLLAGLAVIAATATTLWFSLRREVLRPLADISRTAVRLAEGALAERVPVHRDDELGQTAHSVNRMADELARRLAQAEAARKSMHQLVDSLPLGVRVIRQRDMQVLLANRAYFAQLGRRADEVIDRPCHASSHARATPCAPTLVVCPVVELSEPGQHIKTVQRFQHADGRPLSVEVHAVCIELANDSTQPELRERCIVESVVDLGQAVKVSHEQRLSELGMLAAGIAHEIHNPLASVRLGVQGLLHDLEHGRLDQHELHPAARHALAVVDDYLRLIDSEIDKCIAVTRRLLQLARAPSSVPQLVDVGTVLGDTLSLLAWDAEARRIVQRFGVGAEVADSGRVLADEAELRMVFLNLMQNAHHAMPEGGTLSCHVSLADGQCHVDIEDSGVGMDAATLERIFDPFFSRRADGVTGTGLGLTIVRGCVERANGTIIVVSEPGRGTRFRVSLPLAEHSLEEDA